jgi:hypothetical protein
VAEQTSLPSEGSDARHMFEYASRMGKLVGGVGLLAGTLPSWLIAVSALAYGTGFLIVVTFHDGWGLRETGAEFLKAKYAHVGVLFLAFPAILGGTFIGVAKLRSGQKAARGQGSKDKRDGSERNELAVLDVEGEVVDGKRITAHLHLSSPPSPAAPPTRSEQSAQFHACALVLLMNLALVFYVYAMFAPPRFYREGPDRIVLLFGATIAGLFALKYVPRKWGRRRDDVETWIQMVLLIGLVPLDVYSLWNGELCDTLWQVVRARGWVFVLFVGLFIFVLWRLISVAPTMPHSARSAAWAVGLCLLGTLYYLSAMSFTHAFYPFIRATRGGGDYSAVQPVLIYLRPDRANHGAVPQELLAGPARRRAAGLTAEADSPATPPQAGESLSTKAMIVIDESAGGYFIADPNELGGPGSWRLGEKPRVYWISRDVVAATGPVPTP